MKDEIKEILDKLKDTADTSFFAVCDSQEELDKMPKNITKILSIPSKDAKILYNYITNLQVKYNTVRRWYDLCKSRNEKAIEYIKLVATDHDIMNNNEIIYTQMHYEQIENLLDILQGSDKDE